jgi:protein-disulfide isomerase
MTTPLVFVTIRFPSKSKTNMKRISIALFAAILLSSAVIAQPAPTLQKRPAPKPAAVSDALPTEETMNSFLFQMFGYEPTVTWKVNDIRPSDIPGLADVSVTITNAQGSNQNHLLVSSDGKHAITGEVLPFGAKPFQEAREKLEKGITGPAKGPAKAAVTIVEFSDMQCPHCAKAAPVIDQLLAQEPEAHFVFQNFPLPMHNWAEKAADYVDCIGKSSNDAVWKFILKTFDAQANITEANADEKLKGIATDSGANANEIAACAAKPETKASVEASLALGKSVGVTGTPALFINGRSVPGGEPIEILKKIVDFEASQK